jgi:hypothetical protein
MIMLATQPSKPPTTIQMIKFIFDLQKVSQGNRRNPMLPGRDGLKPPVEAPCHIEKRIKLSPSYMFYCPLHWIGLCQSQPGS